MKNKVKPQLITVGDLRRQLAVFDDDTEVFFGGGEDALEFYRMKLRGKNLLQFEFNQQVYRTDSGELVVED